jgi:hypothetical protein
LIVAHRLSLDKGLEEGLFGLPLLPAIIVVVLVYRYDEGAGLYRYLDRRS